jgi:hypothetical protein
MLQAIKNFFNTRDMKVEAQNQAAYDALPGFDATTMSVDATTLDARINIASQINETKFDRISLK